jgi:flagellar motor switch protein FliM
VEKILNQEEIDQLFRAAQGSAPKTSAAQSRNIRDCDFRQSSQLSKEQVRHLTLLHEAFVPSLANSLGAYLRVAFQTSLVAIEQLMYSEFLARISEQTYFTTCYLQPVDELAGLQLDLPIVFPMIDLLLGGPGKALDEVRDLTEIEEHILESVVVVICRELQATWAPVLPVEFRVGHRLKAAQILNMMLPGDRVLNLSFEIRLAETHGILNVVVPGVISNALLRKLQQQGIAQRRPPSADNRARLRELLLDCDFTLELELDRIPVRIGDVAEMHPNDILPLNHPLHDPMSIAVNGRPVFAAVPVACGPLRGGLIQSLLPAEEGSEAGHS